MCAQSKTYKVKIMIEMSEYERDYIKRLANKKKMTINEFIMSYLNAHIFQDEPNIETQKAMLEVDERKNLTSCNSMEEFWQVAEIDPNE